MVVMAKQQASSIDSRVDALEGRLSEADRLAGAEARLAAHDARFAERERAETQAERERVLSAAAIQKALEEASRTQEQNLVAALKAADIIELERVGRVQDKVVGVQDAASVAIQTTKDASNEYQKAAKETQDQHNGLLDQLSQERATFQTKELALAAERSVSSELASIHKRLDSGEGRTSGATDLQARIWAAAASLAAIGFLIYILAHG